MRRERFQNKVATSNFTLPVAALLATFLWGAGGAYTWELFWGWLVAALMAYLWVEINNGNALIRIRSLLTPAVYVLLSGCVFALHPLQAGSWAALCMLASYYVLFQSYQEPGATVPVFHSFLCLGVGSLFFAPLLWFAPLYLWYAAVFLRSLGWRTFWAAFVGLLLPYWCMAAYAIYAGDFGLLAAHFHELALSPMAGWEEYVATDVRLVAAAGVTGVFSLIASVHYVRTSFNDKIRTRMFHYVLLLQEMFIMLGLAFGPAHATVWLGLLVMNSSPILAHYFALTHKRLTNAVFVLFLVVQFLLAVFSLWMPWWIS